MAYIANINKLTVWVGVCGLEKKENNKEGYRKKM